MTFGILTKHAILNVKSQRVVTTFITSIEALTMYTSNCHSLKKILLICKILFLEKMKRTFLLSFEMRLTNKEDVHLHNYNCIAELEDNVRDAGVTMVYQNENNLQNHATLIINLILRISAKIVVA